MNVCSVLAIVSGSAEQWGSRAWQTDASCSRTEAATMRIGKAAIVAKMLFSTRMGARPQPKARPILSLRLLQGACYARGWPKREFCRVKAPCRTIDFGCYLLLGFWRYNSRFQHAALLRSSLFYWINRPCVTISTMPECCCAEPPPHREFLPVLAPELTPHFTLLHLLDSHLMDSIHLML